MSYVPTPPTTVDDLPRYLEGELARIAEALNAPDVESVRLKTWNVEPDKPREGHVYRADGTNWNPGSGEGIYEYTSGGAWSKL